MIQPAASGAAIVEPAIRATRAGPEPGRARARARGHAGREGDGRARGRAVPGLVVLRARVTRAALPVLPAAETPQGIREAARHPRRGAAARPARPPTA